MTSAASRTYVALVHHPVVDKNGARVTTAVTNLDIHDIARITRTYQLAGYFVVTPIEAQRQLVGRIVGHWTDGAGRKHNDMRTEALSRVRLAPDLADVHRQIMTDPAFSKSGSKPYVVATSAQQRKNTSSFDELVQKWDNSDEKTPILLLFGTGWGMCEEILDTADACLEPIAKKSDYNHLSVRSAVAIVCDRLYGERCALPTDRK